MNFFNSHLNKTDPIVMEAINAEFSRQSEQIELIASENIVSQAVLDAGGCLMTNKYAEGYPGRRYYGGCEHVDSVESLAIERACNLFGSKFANVQPHSGSQANQAVFSVALKPGDSILGMALDQGGHLTHGSKVNMSGKWFDSHFYTLNKESETIDYNSIEKLAKKLQPKMIIAGASAYPRAINFERFSYIAKKVGAFLLVDMAHIAGLVATGNHQNPIEFADAVTTTTHKTLRGPRGGMVLTNNEELAKKINSAVFPGLQGGPLMHIIAAKAVALGEALQPEYKTYINQVIANAKAMGEVLTEKGLRLVTGGTDTHLLLADLRTLNITGKDAEAALERAGLTCNKNAVPYDEVSPFITSGIRLGSPAATSRGFKEDEFRTIGAWIGEVLQSLAKKEGSSKMIEDKIRQDVKALCSKFPIYEKV